MWQEIHNKDNWNKLVTTQPRASFLQSWSWGEFQASLGRRVLRLSWSDEIVVQAIRMPLRFGKAYWYVPRGFIVIPAAFSPREGGEGIQFVQNELFKELEQKFSSGSLFLRIDPSQDFRPKDCKRNSIPSVQAQCVRILDLRLSSDELLAAMHSKTRYNINLAQKKGVAVNGGGIDDFLRLNRQTASRDKFKSHPDYYYQKMAASSSGDFLKIWRASYQNKILGSAIIIYFGDTAAYIHGASSGECREVMAPHLLHWQIIQDAQERGYHYYDLGGVNPEDTVHLAYKKSWRGISRFKAGFGGQAMCYPESFDLIYHPWWYRLYRLAKKFL